ncbi:putative uncharacterized protein [Parachlamydia acanthamoebae UV-7]|uniref:Uncharacterized protein n=2 Tax=Parachlamydia acanthamoebae TaxID=83552 RepID=F8L2D4_PARAV|nr:hypothetical protein DB43_HF00020 [Parachlamydia acanthamoebae]CCB87447.1 putative uncharacterized protein [Parachlamydia acanthamoebae UV-7]
MATFRKMLSMPGMLRSIHKIFSKIRDPKTFTVPPNISIADHLMSGLAVFGLKCPFLLDYDKKRANEITAQNLRDLYLKRNIHPLDFPKALEAILRENAKGVSPTNIVRLKDS